MASRDEDQERTLIFVDMLGFAEHTRRNPTRVFETGPDENGFHITGVTQLQSRVVRFQHVLDMLVSAHGRLGGVSAHVFSDCAFIDLTTSMRAVRAAADMMRDFIKLEVPVRMGIGRGTYYAFKHSIETVDSHLVSKALFAGTAVVRSHGAEQCGAKGCRIFVHESAVQDLAGHDDGMLMPMPKAARGVSKEICYLPKERFSDEPLAGKLRPVDQDVSLVGHLRAIQSDSEPMNAKVLKQYRETHSAINRMRSKRQRRISLKRAEKAQDKVDNDILTAAGLR